MAICKSCNEFLNYDIGFCEKCGAPISGNPQQPIQSINMIDDFLEKIRTFDFFSKKLKNQNNEKQKNILQRYPITLSSGGKLFLMGKSILLINQKEKQIGREDFFGNVSTDILKYISRNHFKIINENGVYYIKDTNSTSGTKLNGKEIKNLDRQPLHNGDKILLANSLEIIFRI